MNTRKNIFAIVLPLSLVILTGCTSLSLKKPDVWPFNIEDNKPGMPTQVVANWTDTILYEQNQTPVRGFGGRLLFYAEGKKEPLKIDGTLVVYAFDEKNHDPGNVKPDRKYVFTKDQLSSHYSKSKLGHSYSIWLPWDDAGGEQKEISLIVRFMPEKGNVVVGEASKHVLPGKATETAVVANVNPPTVSYSNPVQQVAYQTPMQPNGYPILEDTQYQRPRGMSTTTITIPPSSILKSPQSTVPGTNGGNYYPQAMPMGTNGAMPVNQMPPMQPPMMQTIPAQTPAMQMPAAQMPSMPFNGTAMNSAYGNVNSMNAWGQPNPVGPQPNHFGPGQPQVPTTSASQPMPSRGQWPQCPTGPTYGPGTWPAPATNGGFVATPGAPG
jgi:hypothetical protein